MSQQGLYSMNQTNLFEYLYPNYEITKPVRNIEFFAGVSTFTMALRELEADYEPWKICEWDVNAIASNKAIHHGNDHINYSAYLTKEELQQQLYELGISNDGKVPMKLESIERKSEEWLRTTYNNIQATRNLVDITKVSAKDLDIIDTDKYCYILTYSFPCQDLSKAGKQLGMVKDSGTRSSMLWQFERIMVELHEMGIHPDVLIMENVPDVVGTKNIKHFNDWYAKLETLGYQSYYKILNAKNHGIPQNRDRCFMVSIYGEYNYEFPHEIPLELRLRDVLEERADDKYFLSEEYVNRFLKSDLKMENDIHILGTTVGDGKGTNCRHWVHGTDGLVGALSATDYKQPKQILDDAKVKQIGNCMETGKRTNPNQGRIYDESGLAPTLGCMQGGNLQPMVIEPICLNSKVDGKQPSVQDRIYDINAVSTAITTSFMPSIAVPEATKQGYALASDGDYINLSYPESSTRRGRVGKQVAQTLLCNDNNGVVVADGLYTNCSADFDRGALHNLSRYIKSENHDAGVTDGVRIRKLTPLECWRLMGYTDDDFYKASAVNSNSQLYKQAGNGIVKQVAMAIFSAMLPSKKGK